MSRLHYAARRGLLDLLQEGIDAGLLLEEKIKPGFTPLHLAADKGYLGCVRALLKPGADIEAKNNHDQTALHEAASAGHLAVVRELVERGAELEPVDKRKMTPALWAAMLDRRDVLEYLLPLGVDIERVGEQGRTITQWLEVGGVWGLHPVRRRTEESDTRDVATIRKLMAENPNPDEYAAHHGRSTYIFGYGRDTLSDPDADHWAKRYQEILSSPELLAECEERFLTGEGLEQARRSRAAELWRKEREEWKKSQRS